MTTIVAHVMRTYGVHGGERQLYQLFSTFADPGFRHRFFFVYRDDVCKQRFRQVDGLTTDTLLPVRSRTFPSLVAEFSFLFLFLPLLQLRLVWLLARTRSRVCVAHGVQAALVCWLGALLLRQVDFVYVHRGTKSTMGRNRLFRWLYQPFRVVAGVSKASMKSLEGLADPSKLAVIQNGIDLNSIDAQKGACPFEADRDAFVVCCVGRLLPQKGQRLIIEAFAQLCQAWPGSELLIVGDGPDLELLRRLVASEGVASKIRFLGNRTDVICQLGKCDVFAHASESEGLSNAVLEAMAVALPSVVVDAPGVTECHLDGCTGFIARRSAQDVAAKLIMLATDRPLRIRMGGEARKRVCDHYSIEANWRKYSALYQQLVGEQ